jgi:hypothetical protein
VIATSRSVENASTSSSAYRVPMPAGAVNAGKLVVIRNLQLAEKPYSGVHRVVLGTFKRPRSRAVQH